MARGSNIIVFVFSLFSVVRATTTSSLVELRLDTYSSASAFEIQQLLVNRVRASLAGGFSNNIARHVGKVKDSLRSTYRALPKTAHGRIDSFSLKYALRRHFASTRGWHITVLDEMYTAGNSVERELPVYLDVMQQLLRESPGQHGFDLNAIAMIGTIIEHLVIEDALSTLPHAYKAKRHATEAALSSKQVEEVLALHLASYIKARNISNWMPAQVSSFEKLVYRTYPNWLRVKQRLVEVQHELFPGHEGMTFEQVAQVAEEVSVRFAHWQNDDCDSTRSHLQELEGGTRGRVRLGDFYDAALNKGRYQFTEAIDYLREAGMLDESDKLNPHVIVPNYVNGQSNCVARTSSYSVCCMDMCESIFAELETHLGKPAASPDEILPVVESSQSFNVSVDLLDRSSVLWRRLVEVSVAHGGVVFIHGRLFAQWMHLAFPRECAFPHRSGTVYTKSVEQWERDTKKRSGASTEDLQNWVKVARDVIRSAGDTGDEASGPSSVLRKSEDPLLGIWNMEEELLTAHSIDKSVRTSEFQRNRAATAVAPLTLPRGIATHGVLIAALIILLLLGASWKVSVREVSAKKLSAASVDETYSTDVSHPEVFPQKSEKLGSVRARSPSVTPELANLWERFNCSGEVFDIGEQHESVQVEADSLAVWYQR
jgi:hypothetical protein|eukprot:TRINITY_DN54620_c0_g1_i1.p1 TRINITY_DN54620_c0_g1~~TRINITY_DN54620_c0_g1_i1.p1  ORF type:complete len:676 (+),score=81.37 TRINITY_DN54620_c0_g1_i1:62-2029(+)